VGGGVQKQVINVEDEVWGAADHSLGKWQALHVAPLGW